MTNDWKKCGDTYTKRVGGLKLDVYARDGYLHWVVRLSGLGLRFGDTHSLPAAQRAAERFVERLRKAVKPCCAGSTKWRNWSEMFRPRPTRRDSCATNLSVASAPR